jgi:hypothetical protein
MNRIEGNSAAAQARPVRRRRRTVAVAMAIAAVSALAPFAPGVAEGAEEPAQSPPPSAILGGWRVTGHALLPDGASTNYHYERDPAGAEGTADAELQWHRSSAAEIGQQLESQGLQAAGAMPTNVTDQRELQAEDWPNVFVHGTAQVYAEPEAAADGFFTAVGVWEETGFTYALSARVVRLYMLERLLERVERLDGDPQAPSALRRHRHRRRHAHPHPHQRPQASISAARTSR